MTLAMAFLIMVLCALLAYLIGSINLSIIISKLMGKGDIRDYGSKNAGTTNTLRVLGKGPALIVFIWDILKGVIAVNLVRYISNSLVGVDNLYYHEIYCYGLLLASFAVILGHNFPAFFGFRGGKGVATSLGVLLAIEWRIGLICLAAGITGIIIFQFVSAGSLIAAILYPILVCIIGGHFDLNMGSLETTPKFKIPYIIFSFVLSLMVIIRHRSNIERIKNGTENKLRFKKTAEEKIQEEKEKMENKVDDAKEDIKEVVDDIANKASETTEAVGEKVLDKTIEAKEKINEKKEKIDIKLSPKDDKDKKEKKGKK